MENYQKSHGKKRVLAVASGIKRIRAMQEKQRKYRAALISGEFDITS